MTRPLTTPTTLIAATFMLGALALGCGSTDASGEAVVEQGTDAGSDTFTPEAAAPDAPPDVQEAATVEVGPDAEPMARVTILHTGHERGRVLPEPVGTKWVGGAANVAGWWKQVEGYTPETHLALSSGDSWTGPATSTWLKGENVVDLMGLMGYRAVTLGPRDFDYGRDELTKRIGEATFPFVSANTLYADTGAVADFVEPYTIVPIDGVQVGVIGMMDLGQDINPAEISDLVFADYAPTVEKYALEARANGARIIVVLTSAVWSDALALVDSLSIPVDVVFAGRYLAIPQSDIRGSTVVAHSSGNWTGYNRVELDFDRAQNKVVGRAVEWVAVEYEQADGNPVVPDATVAAAADQWEQSVAGELGEEIGYTEFGVASADWPMANWVTDSWLWSFPDADIAMQNSGGLNRSIDAGSITVGDIVSMQPFANYIYRVEMTGAKVRSSLQAMVNTCGASCFVAVSGIRYDVAAPDLGVTLADSTPIDPGATYTVLINSYMYSGGAGFPFDPALDPTPTGMHMRDPVLAWTKQLGTTSADPLENYMDFLPRNQ